jgi:hypothetical protein
MLTTNYTVKGLKDITADDFIVAYAKHLKTQGKFEIPKVCYNPFSAVLSIL